MLHPTDRLMIEDILRVTAARLAGPSGPALIVSGKTSPAHLTLESYSRWGGQFHTEEMQPRGGFKWLRAASVLAHSGVDLNNAGPDRDPRWTQLLASRDGWGRCLGGVASSIAGRIADRADIVKEIVRVTAAAGLAPPVRPTFRDYQRLGGIHPYHHIQVRGGWAVLCAEAGFTAEPAPKTKYVQVSGPPDEALRKLVLQDIARVAAAVAAADVLSASSNGLSKSDYFVAGGHYSRPVVNAVQGEVGWPALCREAGVKPPAPRVRRSKSQGPSHTNVTTGAAPKMWDGTAAAKADGQRCAGVAPFQPPPRRFALMMAKGPRLGRLPKRAAAMKLRDQLDRDEVLADIRLAARSAGVPVPRMSLESYLTSGGRYSAQDLRAFGGFVGCRAAAASRAA